MSVVLLRNQITTQKLVNSKIKLVIIFMTKYITTPEFHTLAARAFNARLAQANLVTKTDFNARLSSYFIGKSHFEEDGTQNYLVFQPIYRYFNGVSGVGSGNYVYSWKSKGFSDENITAPTTSDYKLNPELTFFGTKTKLEFNGSCLKQDKITYYHGKVVNIYIVYEISWNINISNYPTLENCLLGAVSLTKNADIDKYKYSGYEIGFDRLGFYALPSGRTGRNVIIFGVDMS